MNIVFFGTPNYALPVLDALKEANSLPSLIVTSQDKPVGRKQIFSPSPVKAWGETHKIEVLTPAKIDDNFRSEISNRNIDVGILAAYGKLIPTEIIKLFHKGLLVIHPSLLPEYRGASPVQAAIANGDKVTGVTIFKMDEKMDHGPIVYQEETKIGESETSFDLYQRLFKRSAEILTMILPDYLDNKIILKEQKDEEATFTKILKKEDGFFPLENPPDKEKLGRLIRAYYPWPGVWTKWSFDKAQDQQGKIVKFYPGNLMQMEGKNKVKTEDFLKAYPDFPISKLSD